jgi:hypothetical protein
MTRLLCLLLLVLETGVYSLYHWKFFFDMQRNVYAHSYELINSATDIWITFMLSGCFRWLCCRKCWFPWLRGNQYHSSSFIRCACFLFLGYAIQINVILVSWSSRGSILHWWDRGELFLFPALHYSFRLHISENSVNCRDIVFNVSENAFSLVSFHFPSITIEKKIENVL